MSMFQDSQFDSESALVNEINMTPLIDVMLVLLIIFIITLPAINKAVKVNLPKGDANPVITQEESIDVSVTATGGIMWNKVLVTDDLLAANIAESSKKIPAPTLRIFADKEVRYDRVAHVLSAAQGGGLSKIDFVTEPSVHP